MAGTVRVIEKNHGTKIDFRQKGYKLYFGDDDLILRCDNRQREHPVHIDICADEDGNLVTGLDGVKGYYVAQIDIPGIAYAEEITPAAVEELESTSADEELQSTSAVEELESMPTDEELQSTSADEELESTSADEELESMPAVEIPAVEMKNRVPLPLNMDDVTVTLWSIDGLYLNY